MENIITRPRAILFDWDNTLVDSWQCIHEALAITLMSMEHEVWDLSETKRRVRLSLRDSFPKIFGDRWEEARTVYLNSFASTHLEKLCAHMGAQELLRALTDTGYYLAVVSNKTGYLLRREADHLGWSIYFKRLVGAGDAPTDKPDPAPVHLALNGSNITPRDTWFVGDTPLDMECAVRSGCVPVLLGKIEETGEEQFNVQPSLHFLDCGTFLAGIRGL